MKYSVYIKQIHLQLGNRIRELRKIKNYSIEELAGLADLHSTYLGQVERGEANASVSTLLKISKSLDIDLIDLFSFQKIKVQDTEKEKLIYHMINELVKHDIDRVNLCLELIKLVSRF